MMKRMFIVLLAVWFGSQSATLLAQEATPGPLEVLKSNTERLREVVLKSSSDEEMRANVKGMMEGFVNFAEFGQLCLSQEWDGLTEKQRATYLDEFKALLQRTYLKRFSPGKQFTVTYRSDARMNKDGDRAEIKTTIASGEVEADVDYRFHLENGWRVYDIVVDDVSIMRNYRKSFVNVLKKDGFDALVEKMRKKSDEKDDL